MNKKRRLWIAVVVGIAIIVALSVYLLREQPSCCVLVGDYFTSTAIVATNQKIETQIFQTQTATAQAPTGTFTPSPMP